MQIFHWLFKVAREQEKDNSSTINTNDQEKDIIVFRSERSKERSETGKGRKNYRRFAFLCRKDVAAACFYGTLNSRILNNINRKKQQSWMDSMKMKKEEQEIINNKEQTLIKNNFNKVDLATNNGAGNKVLPINETTLSSTSRSINGECGSKQDKKRIVKGDKNRSLSRMKELLRWAAAAKSDKKSNFIGRKVLQFRSRGNLKAVADDEELSNESPKISFRWDVESCSTTSSVYSDISMASSSINMLSINSSHLHDRKGNWITTDSEFVVLEL